MAAVGNAALAAEARAKARRGEEEVEFEESKGDGKVAEIVEDLEMLFDDGSAYKFPSLKRFVMTAAFDNFIMLVVVIAGVLVGLQTDKSLRDNAGVTVGGFIILFIFTVEMVLRILAEFPKPWIYLEDAWNVMDCVIVLVGIVDFILEQSANTMPGNAGPALMVFRLVRLLRIMKLVKSIPGLRIIVSAVLDAIVSVCYVMVLQFLALYIYAVMGVFIFKDNDAKHFGSLDKSLITLFRVMTFDSWDEIVYINYYGCDFTQPYENTPQNKEVWGCSDSKGYPVVSICFFLSFIIITAFIIANLSIGVVTACLNRAIAEVENDPDTKAAEMEILKQEDDPWTNDPDERDISNTQVELSVLKLVEDISTCREEMSEIRQKLSVILNTQ